MAKRIKIPTYDPTDFGNKPGDGPLRAGGNSSLPLLNKGDLPSTYSPLAVKQADAVEIMRDLWGGTAKVRERGARYLPRAPGERPANYNARLGRSVLFNATRRTIEGLVGMVFTNDPTLSDDVPEQIVEQWENIDNAGTHGDVFLRELLQDALTTGHAAILVDFPNTAGTQTAADEAGAYPIRPYWVPIKKDNICSWRTMTEYGRLFLTQLVLKESVYVPDGAYGEVEQVRYRIFARENGTVSYRLITVTDDKRVVVLQEGLYPTQTEIPVAEVVTSGKRSLFESDPPLADLGYLNIAHYQERSDYATAKHMTCVPILHMAGVDQMTGPDGLPVSEVVVGPNNSITSSNPAAKVEYVAHDGQSLAECRTSLEDLKVEMATLGLAMLAPDKRAAETATAKRIDKTTSDSALSVTARGEQDAVERALQFHANYLRLEDGGSIEISRDFENLVMDPQTIAVLSGLVREGQLTLESLWKMLAAGKVLPDDFTPEEEKAALDAEAELARVRAEEQANLAKANAPDEGVVITNPDGSTRATMKRQQFPRLA